MPRRFLLGSLLVASTAAVVASAGVVDATAATSPPRPAAEHVPFSVDQVRLSYTDRGNPGSDRRATVRGNKASELARLFDSLRREPRGTVHCDVAGGPQTTVTFRSAKHVWVARQAACTNVTVTRDGKALPTLLPTKRWDATVSADLGR
jgi:hypothetical protein